MTNPVTKWEIQEFSLEFDTGKLMENFFNLRSFATFGVIHTHHIQTVITDAPVVVAGSFTDTTGITWPEPFAPGVVPTVIAVTQNTGGAPTAAKLLHSAFNVSNTGCDIRSWHHGTTNTVLLTDGLRITAIDYTYDTSLS